uniref:Uncharacterized protein n=1 Tax=Physcomitrium patens TaxID=3218 RepID=A0A2K1J853_PHYPA|nr:hypothetical protein PHYPA_020824 [Physcomitrium patens]
MPRHIIFSAGPKKSFAWACDHFGAFSLRLKILAPWASSYAPSHAISGIWNLSGKSTS